jgi:HAMP domain-containing protein
MIGKLKLAPKFTLLLCLVFLGATILSGIGLSRMTLQQAEQEVTNRGNTLFGILTSVRNYTNTQIDPLLLPKLESASEFIPQAIPSYSVREVFEGLRQQPDFQEYFYKDAVLNPTNPRDLADNFEKNLIERFQNESETKQISGFREDFETVMTSARQHFYKAQPIIITEQSCLRCHSTPEAAPASLLATYGSENGFGWQLNKVLGVQVIYVPSETVFSIARRQFAIVLSIFIGTFALVILLINFLLKQHIIQPIRPMARLARRMIHDEMKTEPEEEADLQRLEEEAEKSDEIGQLARLFKQMAQAVYIREQSFAQQLRQLQVKSEEINQRNSGNDLDINYFKALNRKAKKLRKEAGERGSGGEEEVKG